MRNYVSSIVVVLCGVSVATIYHNRNENLTVKVISIAEKLQEFAFGKSEVPLSKAIISEFFNKYPDLKKYQSDIIAVYKKRNYKSIWYDEKGLIEFADLLYSKVNLIEEEGLNSNLAYKDKIDGIFDSEFKDELSRTDTEIFLSTMYVFYAKKVFRGMDSKKIKEIGWFLPRKDLSYENLLDSLLVDSKLLSKNEKTVYEQYYKLRDFLKTYRQIEKKVLGIT